VGKFGVDPVISLALSIGVKPGSYALLLGSGLSRTAGIPTGWEVTLELVRKVMVSNGGGEDNSADPLKWYREQFGQDPDYSEVIGGLARSQTERRNLLKEYFEPTDLERQEGEKVPTTAHKAIARLVARGYLSVILTTNFDRLTERALEAEGITPTVIDTSDSVLGAEPLQHAGVTVVKINGDYLDTRIKNTPQELENYDPETDLLLDKIFDEYGLIVCGWSGTSDIALKDALRRARSRRYTTYWVSYRKPKQEEAELAQALDGEIIESEGADSFFSKLEEKIEALDSMSEGDPLGPAMAVATVKRYLAEDKYRIRLHDFAAEVASDLRRAVFSKDAFPLGEGYGCQEAVQKVQKRLKAYDTLCETALGALVTGAYWCRENQTQPFVKIFRAAVERPESPEGHVEQLWRQLELYPAVRLLYATGIVCAFVENWQLLRAITREVQVVRTSLYQSFPVGYGLHPNSFAQHLRQSDHTSYVFPDTRYELPMTEYLFKTLREPLGGYIATDTEYAEAFEKFEALLAIVSMNLGPDGTEHGPKATHPPESTFTYERRYGNEDSPYEKLKAEARERGPEWSPLSSGLVEADVETLDVYFKNIDNAFKYQP
jgi:hypothetical protein